MIGRFGGIIDLISAMNHFPQDLEIVSDCCTTLWSLAVIGKNVSIMRRSSLGIVAGAGWEVGVCILRILWEVLEGGRRKDCFILGRAVNLGRMEEEFE